MNKKILACSLLLFASAVAFALPTYWAELSTEAFSGDASPVTSGAAHYQAYYCTVDTAASLFDGNKTVADIEEYLNENFQEGKTAMSDPETGGLRLTSGQYGLDQYTFISYYTDAIANGDSYLAVLFYDNLAFRVFGSDNALLDSGTLTFDDAQSGTVGGWKSVPEPTSALLMLLGVAGLALKRKPRAV